MVDKPLEEYELHLKIKAIDKQVNLLNKQKQKYINDLQYYTDQEYRERETIYKEN